MKKLLLASSLAMFALGCSASTSARMGMLIGYPDVESIDNFQEYAAAKHFTDANPDGTVIAPGETSKITADNLDCIWIHIDRLNVGKGNLPAEFSDEATVAALKKFVADGGSLYLSKHATQLLPALGRISADFAPGIYGDSDGGMGTDVWTVNAQIGYWFVNEKDNPDGLDASQYYDHRDHEIYVGLETNNDFPMETFALLGTGNGTEMWREDHNCMWDLNAYNAVYTADGKNTVEKFENQNNATVLGTWGHVQDHAVAGIVEFKPVTEGNGTIIANGLAACEWSPRQGVNAFHSNLVKLTDNTLNYLTAKNSAISDINGIAGDIGDAPAEYFTIQGIAVNPEALTPGIYIVRQGNTVNKISVR